MWEKNKNATTIAEALHSGRQYFDFVIFDEPSRVLPEDAVPSILRAHKLVVAGDSKQLPPTTFFAGSDVDESVADNLVLNQLVVIRPQELPISVH